MPDLDRLVPELAALVGRLEAAKANRYRIFRFEGSGAIKACFVFLRMDVALAAMDAETLALVQAVQTIVLWADRAFDATSPLARAEGGGDPAAHIPPCAGGGGGDPADRNRGGDPRGL